MILGFIGTGKISSSFIYGIFKSKLKVKRIYISSRNKNIAKKLALRFRSVKILRDNQEIINKSSTVLLALTPNVGNKIILGGLAIVCLVGVYGCAFDYSGDIMIVPYLGSALLLAAHGATLLRD